IFLGRGVSSNALAAINMSFPAVITITAIAMAISFGGANLISMFRGEGNLKRANEIFSQCIALMIIFPLVVGMFCTIFVRPIARLLGATDLLLPDVTGFLGIYMAFCVCFVMSFGLNTFVRNDGNPKLSMYGTIASTAANIVFAGVFIFVFKWGVRGAASANILSQTVAIIVYVTHFFGKKGDLRFSKPVFIGPDILRIIKIGLPSMLMELSMSFTGICFNLLLIHRLGETGVAAYSIVNYIVAFANMFLMGITQGLQPILSFSHGARDRERVSAAYKLGLKFGFAFAAASFVLLIFIVKNVVMLFTTTDQALINLAGYAALIFCLGNLPASINLINITFFQATERVWMSNAVCLMRGFIFILAGMLILPAAFGNGAVWYIALFAEGLTLISTFFLKKIFKGDKMAEAAPVSMPD
ncbi:MAG: MATE family efflux transporter, partial [Clostridiales bacterium]|nr:MATE family efflux transporter [Clostridiales bacterium]